MPRVSRNPRNAPRNSVKDRPTRWRMWVRRARRMVRPGAWCGPHAREPGQSVIAE